MAIPLRQSTASQEVPLGMFVDSTDGNTEETGLTIANTAIWIWRQGATTIANKNSGGATHIQNGIYYAVLDATDTATLGGLVIFVHVAGALPVRVECVVLSALVYDSLIDGSDNLQVDAVQISGDTTAADRLEAWMDAARSGTAQAGAASTITLDSGASTTDDFYNGWMVMIASGTGAGQSARLISDYVGSTRVATITPNWITNPDNTSVFALFPSARADVGLWLGSAPNALVSGRVDASAGAVAANAINAAAIATDAITAAKIADGAIDAATFAAGAINAAAIADNAIDAGAIADGAITAAKIATNAIDADALAADAVSEIQSGLATASALATVDTVVDAILVDTDTTIPGLINGLNNLSAAQVNAEVDTALADIRLDELMENALTANPAAGSLFGDLTQDNGSGTQQFTEIALENAPAGGGGGEADWTATERAQIRYRLGMDGSTNTPTATPNLATAANVAAVETDTQDIQARLPAALVSGRMAADAQAISGSTTAADNVEANIGNLDTTVSSRLSSAGYTAPDNSSIAAILVDTGTTIPAQIDALNDLSAAQVNAEVDQALADYDAPTNAEMVARTLASASYATAAQITALNNLSAAQVNAEVDAALADYDGPTNAEMVARTLAAADYATASAVAVIDAIVDAILEDTGTTLPALINALNDLSAAEVNAQVLDVLNTDTFAEPSAVPAANATLAAKIGWLYVLARNTLRQTATTQTLRNDANAANIATATVSDDGTTFERGEWS